MTYEEIKQKLIIIGRNLTSPCLNDYGKITASLNEIKDIDFIKDDVFILMTKGDKE